MRQSVPQGGGLACPIGSQKGKDLIVGDPEAEVVDGCLLRKWNAPDPGLVSHNMDHWHLHEDTCFSEVTLIGAQRPHVQNKKTPLYIKLQSVLSGAQRP